MATNTTNLSLIKPAGTDKIRIAQINQNMDILDEKIGPVGNTSLQAQVTNLNVPKRVVAKSITASSQSDLDSQLATECSTLGYGTFEIIELYGNWSGGSSPTNGARSLATLHRLNLSGVYYMCYVHYTRATGYYYSGAWHWDLGLPAINSKLTNYLKSGTNNIGNIIVPGYNTGSGNYIDCFVPCSTGGKTVSSASASSSTLVYLPTKRISFSSAPTITVLETNAYGVRLEIAYPSTETANITGTVYLVNLMLTCS